jgi:hypothetical protein
MTTRKLTPNQIRRVEEAKEAATMSFDNIVIAIGRKKLEAEGIEREWTASSNVFRVQANKKEAEIQKLNRLLKLKKEYLFNQS